jgi:SSS family solute:Na+ symporter
MQPAPLKSKNESNWKSKLAFLASYIPGSGILLIAQFANSGENEILLLFLEPLLAVAFGIVFFLPLWQRMNIEHESDFILRRFSGKGAKLLFDFRNYYLALVVIPLLIALQIKSASTFQLHSLFGLNYPTILFLILVGFTVIGYNMKRLIRVESIIALFTLLATFIHLFTTPVHSEFASTTLPSLLDWKMLLPPILFFWWFTGPVDMPDMRAQKLLAHNSISSHWIILPYCIIFLSQGIFLVRPLNANEPYYELIIIALSLNVATITLSYMHWASALLLSKRRISSTNTKLHKSPIPAISLALPLALAFMWYNMNQKSQDLFATFLLFAAGVGPVFLLRWFVPQVNAWTQLSAMLGAIVIPPFIKLGMQTSSTYSLIFIADLRSKEEILSKSNWLKFLALTALFTLLVTGISLLQEVWS